MKAVLLGWPLFFCSFQCILPDNQQFFLKKTEKKGQKKRKKKANIQAGYRVVSRFLRYFLYQKNIY